MIYSSPEGFSFPLILCKNAAMEKRAGKPTFAKATAGKERKASVGRYDMRDSIKSARTVREKTSVKPFDHFDPRREPFAGNKKRAKPFVRKVATRPKSAKPKKPRTTSASWGSVASWYGKHLEGSDTYHEKVILPNLLRLIDPKKGGVILDVACGEGYFTRALAQKGASAIGVDISEELVAIAKKKSPEIPYHVGSAEKLSMIANNSLDKTLCVLAIQNIGDAAGVFAEVARVLKPAGSLHLVMNHPAFRIPKQSSWDYDAKRGVQCRRIEQYLSESKAEIDMHPGMKDSPRTISYHRPLQYYFKALAKAGFAVEGLEEWISHKESVSGPRARAENRARHEIPLFAYIRAQKIP